MNQARKRGRTSAGGGRRLSTVVKGKKHRLSTASQGGNGQISKFFNYFLRFVSVALFLLSQYQFIWGEDKKGALEPLVGAVLFGLSFFFEVKLPPLRQLFRAESPSKPLSPSRPFFLDKYGFGITALLFVFYVITLMWRALTQTHLIIGGFDMLDYYPYRLYWIRSLLEGDPALWNPYFKIGQPFLAWPTVTPGSPFNLLWFIFPGNYALTVETALHYLLAAFGFYVLMRSLGCGWKAGALAGMAYSFGGYFMARTLQAQVWLWFTAAWAPWVVWAADKALKEKRVFWVAVTSLLATLTYFEGHPQMTQYVLIIMGAYLVGSWISGATDWKTFLQVGVGTFVGFVLTSAVLLVPQSHFVRYTDRWHWGYTNIMENYITPDALMLFLDPMRGAPMDPRGFHLRMGYQEVGNYLGYIPLALFFASLFYARKIGRVLWMSLIVLLFGLMAMGESNFASKAVFNFFYHFFPFFTHHRSLGRLMIIADFFAVCCAGLAFDYFERKFRAINNVWSWVALAAVLVTAVDLWHYGHVFFDLQDAGNYTNKGCMFPERVVDQVLADPSYPRIQPQNEGDASLVYKLAQPFVVPEDTLIQDVADYIHPMRDRWDSPLADLVNMKYIFSERLFAAPTDRWKPLEQNIVVNAKALPRAFVVGGYENSPATGNDDVQRLQNGQVDGSKEVLLYSPPDLGFPSQPAYLGEAKISHYGNNEVEFDCATQQPGLLFFSDPYFPGWEAEVDGQSAPLLKADHCFRAVPLPHPGSHHIRMAYRPWDIRLGALLSLIGWLSCGGILFFGKKLKFFAAPKV